MQVAGDHRRPTRGDVADVSKMSEAARGPGRRAFGALGECRVSWQVRETSSRPVWEGGGVETVGARS